MTLNYQTLAAPAKDWCFAFTWRSADYNISRQVKKFTVTRIMYREDAVAKLREFFQPDLITNIHLQSVRVSKPMPE